MTFRVKLKVTKKPPSMQTLQSLVRGRDWDEVRDEESWAVKEELSLMRGDSKTETERL